MKKRKRYLFGTAIVGMMACGMFFFSCEKDEIVPNQFTPQAAMEENNGSFKGENEEKGTITVLRDNCGVMISRPLVTQGGISVGKAIIYNDKVNFYVKLITKRDYYIGKAYAHIAYDVNRFPLDKKGNPYYARFDYQELNPKPKNELYFKIPYEKIELRQFLSSVMCEVFSLPDRPGIKMHAWIQGRPYGETIEGKIFAYSTKTCRKIDNGFEDDNAEL